MDQPITRREAIRKGLIISGSVLLAGTLGRPDLKSPVALAEQKKGGFVVEGVGKAEGYSVAELTKRVFDAAGGMQQFVSKGDVVVVKPNISWARAPNFAATTNPEVLEAVIKLAFNAGAKKVRIVDNTIHDARRCFALSGAGMVAKKTGADLIYPRSSLMRDMKIQGHRLDVWPVFTPVIEADKVINIPVAKVHTLSKLTLGMKNWIGGVGGRRNALHQDIHQTIVDLAQFFKPSVTLIDAIRVMVKNGPSGGSESDVAVMNRLILSNDPVAADAKGAGLFQIPPQSIGFILLAEKRGLGTSDLTKLNQQKVIL
ncbi:MAG: DUF362 domain-containing protein [Pseudomonadota bacterium]